MIAQLRPGVTGAPRRRRAMQRTEQPARQPSPSAPSTAGAELVALQRLVGNQAVSALLTSQRIQRETEGDAGSGAAVRNTAFFPGSLSVSGALAAIGQTSVGGSALAASLSSS